MSDLSVTDFHKVRPAHYTASALILDHETYDRSSVESSSIYNKGPVPEMCRRGTTHSEVIESETDIVIVITLDYISSNNPQ